MRSPTATCMRITYTNRHYAYIIAIACDCMFLVPVSLSSFGSHIVYLLFSAGGGGGGGGEVCLLDKTAPLLNLYYCPLEYSNQ